MRCGADGLFLAGAQLIEKRGDGYHIRPDTDLERLLRRAYGGKVAVAQIAPGLKRAVSALSRQAVWLAPDEATRLPLPELPNPIAALRLEIEDLLITAEELRKALLRVGWDPGKHPRAGVRPNPGWFAPTEGSATVYPIAGSEEEERPEEASDPLAEIRQRLWQSGQTTLRAIDPANLQQQSLHGPNWVPSQADLDTLYATIRDVEVRRIVDRVTRDGVLIGTRGNGPDIQLLPGGLRAAERLFDYLRAGGMVYRRLGSNGAVIKLPGNVGFVTFRPKSESGPPALEINIIGNLFAKFHFLGG